MRTQFAFALKAGGSLITAAPSGWPFSHGLSGRRVTDLMVNSSSVETLR